VTGDKAVMAVPLLPARMRMGDCAAARAASRRRTRASHRRAIFSAALAFNSTRSAGVWRSRCTFTDPSTITK
jgi:hypothetical protein